MSDFVLEIGVENIPASYIAPAIKQLEKDTAALLATLRLEHGELRATGTPRRLVVIVSDLADRQSAAEEFVTGPPVSRGFDESGKPTAAAVGFARSQGIDVANLQRIETAKGEYLGIRRRLPRRKAAVLLRDALEGLVSGLRFPRSMKWEPLGARFARPVRWMVALHGATPVRFSFAGVTSGTKTWARPWMRGESAVVRSAATYEKTVARLGVQLDQKARRERIRELAERAAAKQDLTVIEDPELLDELCFMLENPRLLMGSFPEHYLLLPSEVVTTAMRSHQRYIALSGARKKLAPKFITFTDWPVSAPAEVRRGTEKVLRARLEDALFYWREDLKRGVDGLAEELDRIVFIEGLGTIGEKYRRIERIALTTNARLEKMEPAEDAMVARAAKLCKADLASEMIKDGKEFTKLQGVIGAQYARESGEAGAVVEAIRDHYQPRTPDDRPPRSTLAVLIAVGDRIDTICGCFLAGFKPTGSQDPYGLRRSANGLIRIIDGEPGVRLDELIDQAIAAYGDSNLLGDRAAARDDVIEFMKTRAEAYLKDHQVPYDVANAVVPISWVHPGEALRRGSEIAALRGDEGFERLITGVKRVGNIIAPETRLLGEAWTVINAAVSGAELRPGVSFGPSLFEDEAEERLAEAVSAAVPALEAAESAGRFREVLIGLSGLADPIDHYFDKVLVNCEEEAVRSNRHHFLAVVYAIFGRYADFSRIVEEGER